MSTHHKLSWLNPDDSHKPKSKWPKGYWFYRKYYHTIREHVEQYRLRRSGGIGGFRFSHLRELTSRINEERHIRLTKTNDGLNVTIVVSGRFPHGYEYRLKPRSRKPLNKWDQEKHNKACRAIIRILKRHNAKRLNNG